MGKSLLLGLLLCVTGAQAEIVHQESFSDGTADLTWQSTWGTSADQVAVDWMSENPSGDGFVGTLGNSLSGGGVGTAVVSAPDLSDYQLSTQVYLTPNTTHYRGIVGRVTEFTSDTTSSWGFYAFVADLSQGGSTTDERLMLRKWLPGGQAMTTIKVWSHAELGALYPSTAGWYNLGMSFQGTQITCSINGTVLPNGTQTDNSFSAGGFGVYYFDMTDQDGHLSFDDVVVDVETSLAPLPEVPERLSLGNPWPNPFNPVVHQPLLLAQASRVNARVYDLGGRQVAQLIEGTLAAGAHDLVWNGLDLSGRPAASGLYLLQVEAGGVLRESKLTLLR